MPERRSLLRVAAVLPVLPVLALLGSGCSDAPASSPDTVRTPGGVPVRYLPGVDDAVRAQLPGEVDEALTRVRSVWSAPLGRVNRTPTPPGEVLVPATSAQFTAGGGDGATGVAATTRSDGTVVLSPQVWTGTSAAGRVVVLAHEFTHVALHSQTSASARWLVEGPPEWTAYRDTGLELAQIAPRVAAIVRAGGALAGPPADAQFDGPLQSAYQSAFTWCSFLADRFGTDAFSDFVVAFTNQPASRLAGGFEARFGVQIAALRVPYLHFQRASFK